MASKVSLGTLQCNDTYMPKVNVTNTHQSNHRRGKGGTPVPYHWLKSVRIHLLVRMVNLG